MAGRHYRLSETNHEWEVQDGEGRVLATFANRFSAQKHVDLGVASGYDYRVVKGARIDRDLEALDELEGRAPGSRSLDTEPDPSD